MTNTQQCVYHDSVLGKLLDQLGLGLSNVLGKNKKQRESPVTRERVRFEQEVKEQLVALKKKGLSIPVFTL